VAEFLTARANPSAVVRREKRANDSHEDRDLNTHEPREVPVDLLVDGIESLVHLLLQSDKPQIHVFEPPVNLFEPPVNLFETVVYLFEKVIHLLEPPIHLILQSTKHDLYIGRAHGVRVDPRLECGDALLQCRHERPLVPQAILAR